ncbi:MAG TPA: 8-oxo-dGTP diphosphatase [Acidobacteriota bacterium]|nr:8-oxo-dGTP diphosphatase [Acidobacteriota bacterium]
MKEYTLVFVLDEKNKKILLGMKKRGFGMGNWNGFGGKVNPGESVYAAAERELHEECGLTSKQLTAVGTNEFTFADGMQLKVFNFVCTKYTGTVQESDEMKPEWFSYTSIPYDTMWPDDKYWVPFILDHKTTVGTFFFKDQKTIGSQDIKITGIW